MGPLDGVRVLDLSRLLPGGALTQLLGDLGADVVKVERPGTGDDARRAGPLDGDTSAVHRFLDRNKRSVAVDLKTPEGVALVHRLAAGSDAVVESFRPGAADRLGIGYAALREHNPALVYCSVNGYGAGGPRAQAAGHDLDYCAYAGMYDHGGPPAGAPQICGAQLADISGGLLGAVGLLAALHRARATGSGEHVEVALADAALWSLGIHHAAHLAGEPAGPATAATSGAYPCYQLYRCADDRHLAVGALEPHFWQPLVAALGREDLEARQYDASAIAELAELFATRPLAHWVGLLEPLDACVAPVQTFAEVVADPQFDARGMFVPPAEPGTAAQVGCPIKLASGAPPLRPAPARVGQDGDAVLADLG